MSEVPSPYRLLDSGRGRKLESLGGFTVDRQAPQAFWRTTLDPRAWADVDAVHHRSDRGGGHWEPRKKLPSEWPIQVGDLTFKARLTPFGHAGFFAEQADQWTWLRSMAEARTAQGEPFSVLNLFAYTGGSTLALAMGGAEVTHVDAAQGVVTWARENAALNHLEERPIRWIVDDCLGFVTREARRGKRYHGVVLDPPTYGRGKKGEVFKIEDDLPPLLDALAEVVDRDRPLVLLSCHTPGFGPLTLTHLLEDAFGALPELTGGEMVVAGADGVRSLPSGVYCRNGASS